MSIFVERIRQACQKTTSLVCVGLDPDLKLMPVDSVYDFNRAIVEATCEAACAYKPNLAFYEALGMAGLTALERTVSYIRDVAKDALIIGDAKRGDIGPSARAYASAMFDSWGFDAVTVNAWGGSDSIEPFLEYASQGVFVWCRGSNPGSRNFQDLPVLADGSAMPVYERMARACSDWNSRGNVGLVVGATAPEQLAKVRAICPGMPLLMPGVGAQGGDLERAVLAGVDAGGRLALVNSSRGIIYASSGADFAAAAGNAAFNLRGAINDVLEEAGLGWRFN